MSRRLFGIFAVLIALSFIATPAFAKGKKKKSSKKTKLELVLGEIEWGDSKDEILNKLKTRLMKEAKKDGGRDMVLMQRKRKEVMQRHNEAKKSYTQLTGESTGYEVSVIADEFSTNNGESFIRIKDKVAQRFFFFIDGKFYKLVVSYNATYLRNVGFESFVGSSARKYGRPAEAKYDEIRGKEQLALVRWSDPTTQLEVKNKKELFDTYTMAFADRQTIKRLRKSKRKFGGSDKDSEEISASVKSLMQGSDSDANANVVDNLTGNTDINLSEGRPVDDQKRYDKDGNVIEVEDTPKEATKKTKKKKTKKKKKKKKKSTTKKAPDFSKLKQADDDLIIY